MVKFVFFEKQMNKTIHKIPEYFKIEQLRNDKRIVVFLVCLAIATGLWFLNALSKDYSTTISYPVRYVNPPKRQFLANNPPSKLELKVDAHGFTLLRHKLSLSFSPIILNLSNITRDLSAENGTYSIPSSAVMKRISSQVSNEISILEIHPDIIPIVLDSLKEKTVPVHTDISLGFKPQYNLKNPVSLEPQEVSITGPSAIIDTIQSLSTEKHAFEELDESVKKYLDIVHPKKVSIEPKRVMLNVDVEKYTEKVLRVPVLVRNKPDNVTVKLFPSEINLTCLVGLSEFEDITASSFSAYVNYDEIQNNGSRLSVLVEKKSSYIQLIRTAPETVEYLTEMN